MQHWQKVDNWKKVEKESNFDFAISLLPFQLKCCLLNNKWWWCSFLVPVKEERAGFLLLWLAITAVLKKIRHHSLFSLNLSIRHMALKAIQTELVLTLLHPFFFMCQWDGQKTSLQLVPDWQGNFRCSTEGHSAAFLHCGKIREYTYILIFF